MVYKKKIEEPTEGEMALMDKLFKKEEPVEEAAPKEAEQEPPLKSERQELAQIKRTLKNQKHVQILIPSGRGEDEKSAVFVGINGYNFYIPRDQKVSVPIAVARVLQNAVNVNYSTKAESDGTASMKKNFSPRFPMQIWE